MLTPERHSLILQKLQDEGRVISAELSTRLNVSEDTVRRDLRQLSEAGLLLKVHGGAVPRSTTKLEFSARAQEQMPGKHAIALAAAPLVKAGMVVFFDAGTSALELARALPRDVPFTAVTHSPLAAVALNEFPLVEVHLVGGQMLKRGVLALGPETIAGYRRIRADLCFLGVAAVDLVAGITDPSPEEAAVKSAMIANAAALVVLATADKLGKISHFVASPSAAIDHLVTDAQASAPALAPWREAGVDVIVATLPGG